MIFTLGLRGLSRTLGPAEHTFKHNAGSNSELVLVVLLLVVVHRPITKVLPSKSIISISTSKRTIKHDITYCTLLNGVNESKSNA